MSVIDLQWTDDSLGLYDLETGQSEAGFLWTDLREIQGVEPEPAVRFVWEDQGSRKDRLVLPWPHNRETFLSRVDRVERFVAEHFPAVRRSGWVAAPEVSWEQAAVWPERNTGAQTASYRDAPREELIAEDPPPRASSFSSLWARKQGASDTAPAQYALSTTSVYARAEDGSIWSLPLSALRKKASARDGTTFTFGRFTTLSLPSTSQVVAALNRRLLRTCRARTNSLTPS